MPYPHTLLFMLFLFLLSSSVYLTIAFSLSFLSLSQIQREIWSATWHSGMSLRAYFSAEYPCGDVFDRKESEVLAINEIESKETGSMDLHQHAIEFDVIEFWPVEHPMEPQDEDRPVKCPMPASSSSSINDGKENEERVAAESSRKRSELPETTANKGIPAITKPPVRAVRKRHHTLTQDDRIMKPLVRMSPLPPLPTQSLTIFQMLQEFDEFNS